MSKRRPEVRRALPGGNDRRCPAGHTPAPTAAPAADDDTAAHAADAPDVGDTVKIPYKFGARALEQEWTHVAAESVRDDARSAPRNRATLNKDKPDYNSPYLMWLNVALPMNLALRALPFARPHVLRVVQ